MTIREARLKANMTQQEVSTMLEIPLRTLKGWELGQRVPPVYVEKLVVEKLQQVVKLSKAEAEESY